ncbi:hypothetical protein EOW77_0013225 [Bradyrhizobium yuanmingense]|nr:hypothetical protein EOW77_0013225 [Bradyrhizobium yuanmingense]
MGLGIRVRLIGSSEGYDVSSVASREMAAGVPALTAMNGLAQESVLFAIAGSIAPRQAFAPGALLRSSKAPHGHASGNPVPQQKHTEIRFEGAVASCYLSSSMGAEGGVTDTSRRPN